MIRYNTWPPPTSWTEMVIPWSLMLSDNRYNPRSIFEWLEDTPGGRYHVHGWDDFLRQPHHGLGVAGIDGIAFRFEQPQDAVLFKLRWA